MIQPNCRARFTAQDFEFVVRVLARDSRQQVSLVELLTDPETRDQILDHECLYRAILENTGNLSRGLAGAENHLGHACTQSAVMIHLGESQIFEWKMPQLGHGIVGRKLSPADLFKKLAYRFGIQSGSCSSLE